ncbi:hypothetical protein JHK82_050636 [Glycine max]|nr:hypothetical protein JHK85_051347 [Glycine max]KAG5091858.1 hypothetical protein JHK82_050636 [Glycine max]
MRSFKVKSRGYTWEDTPLGETLGRFSGQRPGAKEVVDEANSEGPNWNAAIIEELQTANPCLLALALSLSQTLPHKPLTLLGLPLATVVTPYSESRKATVRPWSRFGRVYWDVHRRLPCSIVVALGLVLAISFIHRRSIAAQSSLFNPSSRKLSCIKCIALSKLPTYKLSNKVIGLIISEFVSTSLAFACFSAAALVARRREYLYLGGLLSSGLSILQLHSSSLRSLFKNKDFLFCVPPKCPATVGYLISPERKLLLEKNSLTEANLINPPPSFPPSSTIRLHPHEARELAIVAVKNYGNGGISFGER